MSVNRHDGFIDFIRHSPVNRTSHKAGNTCLLRKRDGKVIPKPMSQ